MKQQLADRVGELSGKATMSVSAAGVLWGWITVEQIFSLLSLIVGLAGLAATIYFKRKTDARNEREAALREELLRARIQHLREGASPAARRADTDWGSLEADQP